MATSQRTLGPERYHFTLLVDDFSPQNMVIILWMGQRNPAPPGTGGGFSHDFCPQPTNPRRCWSLQASQARRPSPCCARVSQRLYGDLKGFCEATRSSSSAEDILDMQIGCHQLYTCYELTFVCEKKGSSQISC